MKKYLQFKKKTDIIGGADALVAQLDRASDYGSEGCEFESRRAHHKNRF